MTNGNLTAPQSTTINGKVLDNGVYNYGGDFPIASQYYANFWVDVAFSPSASSSAERQDGGRRRLDEPIGRGGDRTVGLHHHLGRIGYARRADGRRAGIAGDLVIDGTATVR